MNKSGLLYTKGSEMCLLDLIQVDWLENIFTKSFVKTQCLLYFNLELIFSIFATCLKKRKICSSKKD